MLIFQIVAADGPSATDKSFKILHVMSYHATWKWNREQFQGFQAALADVDVEYRVVELDSKRYSEHSDILTRAQVAQAIIRDWKPDLLYANDDNAQQYVSRHLVGKALPIVFSAVNRDPSEYDFIGAKNVTGVIEHEHVVPTIRLLTSLVPDVRRIAVVVDSDPTWKGVMARIRNSARQVPDIEIAQWVLINDLNQFKERMMALQQEVDAVAMLGVFNIKDAAGQDVDYETILRWVTENSRLPDFSFWQSRVERGTLCAVAISGYEQGHLAGEMARQILVDGVSPASIPMRSSAQGLPMINLARAKQLGLSLDVDLLLRSETLPDYAWDH